MTNPRETVRIVSHPLSEIGLERHGIKRAEVPPTSVERFNLAMKSIPRIYARVFFPPHPYSAASFSASREAFSSAAFASTSSTMCSTISRPSIVWSVLPAL
jgi:hypothetical protein